MDAGKSLDAQLYAWSSAKVRQVGAAVVLFCFLLDVTVSVLLREAPSLVADTNVEWSLVALGDGLSDPKRDTADVLLLSILRIGILIVIAIIAVQVGRPKLDDIKPEEAVCPPAAPTEPLLINGVGAPNTIPSRPRGRAQIMVNGRLQAAVEEGHLLSYKRKQSAALRKNIAIGALYLTSTASQVYVGIKCIGFEGAWAGHSSLRTVQGALMFGVVVVTNLEAFLVTRLVNAMTREVRSPDIKPRRPRRLAQKTSIPTSAPPRPHLNPTSTPPRPHFNPQPEIPVSRMGRRASWFQRCTRTVSSSRRGSSAGTCATSAATGSTRATSAPCATLTAARPASTRRISPLARGLCEEIAGSRILTRSASAGTWHVAFGCWGPLLTPLTIPLYSLYVLCAHLLH